ncbi:hypothetical protein BDR07DRAFT_873955 [Suillus spraguei]|nr:hypothetical protein BDR07DRAFT_873955 [Suillus spraguei]
MIDIKCNDGFSVVLLYNMKNPSFHLVVRRNAYLSPRTRLTFLSRCSLSLISVLSLRL